MIGAIVAQICMILFAIMSAPEEGHFTWPFRVLSEKDFTREQKKKHSSGAHRWGYAGVIFVGIGLGILGGLVDHRADPWIYSLLLSLACGVVYGFVFDPAYALFIGQKWDYVGNPKSDDPYNSGSDDAINKIFGKHAGAKKAVLFLLVLGILNVSLYLL